MGAGTSAKLQEGSGPTFITPVILVSGVVVGLILVISVIFCCKYCLKQNKRFQRKPYFWGRIGAGKPITKRQDYDSVASTASGEQSTTTHTSSTLKQQESSATTSESLRVENEIDAAVAEYKKCIDGELDLESQEDLDKFLVERQKAPPLGDITAASSDTNRHVSFVLEEDETNQQDNSKTTSPSKTRYTEGDFHHLKSARIDRPPSLSKFKSLSHSVSGSSEIDPLASSTGLVSFHDDPISEVTPMLSPVCEEPTKTQVLAEVHRDPNGSRVNGFAAKAGRSTSRDSHNIRPDVIVKSNRITSRLKPLRQNSSDLSRYRELPSVERTRTSKHTLALIKEFGKERQSWSLELVPAENKWAHESRRVKSYEEDFVQKRRDDIDYDRSRITQFGCDFSVIASGLSPEAPSKARYNDIGSFEDISDIPRDVSVSESETINGSHCYKELWQLRSTLEEEKADAADSIKDDVSETLRLETMSSPEHSIGEPEPALSVTTSFESNTEPVLIDQSGTSEQCSSEDTVIRKGSAKLLHPNYESRRRTYQNIFTKKVVQKTKSGGDNSKHGDNSFDSFETMDTDGDVSESSRQEFTTTSFESTGTTDNTDSTGDSASHKLQQMRGDSGYKSLETQQSQTQPETVTQTRAVPRKQIHFVLDDEVISKSKGGYSKATSLPETSTPSRNAYSRTSHYFDRRAVKSASKKRRDFRSDRQNLRLQQGIQEGESDSRSDQPSGDSFEETPTNKGRFSIFNKIIRSKSDQSPRRGSLIRDFSIDEKTDAVFNEFLRHDPKLEQPSGSSQFSPQSHRPRLQRKTSEAYEGSNTRPKHRLGKNTRSASVDQSTINVSRVITKLSSQDSIEEESGETESHDSKRSHSEFLPHQQNTTKREQLHSHGWKSVGGALATSTTHTFPKQISVSSLESNSPKHSTKFVQRIPIIKLPTVDSTDL